MRTVSIAELRQNPNPTFDAVERGETVVVTRYRKEIGRIVPPVRHGRKVSGLQVMEILRRTPLSDDSWARDLAEQRAALDAEWTNPWDRA